MDAADKAAGHGGATGPAGNHGGAPAGAGAGGVQQLQATRDDRKTDGGLGRFGGGTRAEASRRRRAAVRASSH
ncbi:hypothetical protein TRIUR3_16603 [Triticum urartu]|uniref:Uncharacterized protein n=1 Tax=Triticum urartu TaxID=4572 RepID=M7ZMU1_TRIUA|nr:hypothetical protein TRIUR3_16603 [Triticum urartu]